MKYRLAYLAVALGVLLLDQVTKLWVIMEFHPLQTRGVIPGLFTLVYNRNTGGAFGLFRNLSDGPRSLIFISVPCAIIVVILVWAFRSPTRPAVPQVGLAFILGGAMGNMLDRIRFGYVVDFLLFHLGRTGWQWPAFNVADSFITLGVGVLLLHLFLEPERQEETREAVRPGGG